MFEAIITSDLLRGGILVAIAVRFVWTRIVHLVAYMSGRKRTAQQFGIEPSREFPDDQITYGSLQIGNSNYNNSVTIAIDQMGIYMRTIWLFRAGHQPLFIPRGAIVEVEKNPISAYREKLKVTAGHGTSVWTALTGLLQGHGPMTDSYRITVGSPSLMTFMFGGRISRRRHELLESKVTVDH